MMKFILGKKLGMSQIYDKQGNAVPVTVIEAGPCFVTQVKEENKDGYRAVQVGLDKLRQNKIKRPQKDRPFKHLKEFRLVDDGKAEFKTGDKIDVSIFSEGDRIKVSAISMGKGFQGVVKRHGFSGGPASHGHRHVLRRPGSIGTSFPERVIKGKKMPGRAGAERVTIKNLKIAFVDSKNNLIAVSGAVPGPKGILVEINSI